MRSPSSSLGPDHPKVVEIQEFARLRRDGDLVPVHRYRTIYHPDGRISHEALSSKVPPEKAPH